LGEAYLNLSVNNSISLNKLAENLGISPSSFKEHIQYSKLETDIKKLMIECNIKERRLLRIIKNISTYKNRKIFIQNEIFKRKANLGKYYNIKKRKFLLGELFCNKLKLELNNLNYLSILQRVDVKKAIEIFLLSIG